MPLFALNHLFLISYIRASHMSTMTPFMKNDWYTSVVFVAIVFTTASCSGHCFEFITFKNDQQPKYSILGEWGDFTSTLPYLGNFQPIMIRLIFFIDAFVLLAGGCNYGCQLLTAGAQQYIQSGAALDWYIFYW